MDWMIDMPYGAFDFGDLEVEMWPGLADEGCPDCGGRGYFRESGDMVPYGSTMVSLPDFYEPCDCVNICYDKERADYLEWENMDEDDPQWTGEPFGGLKIKRYELDW